MNIIRSIDTRFKNFSIEYIVFLPIIHYKTMKVIYNSIIPFKGFAAINLLGVVFARKECRPLSDRTLRHEAIHTAQMRELAYIGFYIIYLLEWLFRLLRQSWTGENAYRSISFEKEAYRNQDRKTYLSYRKHFAQWRR